MARAGIMLVLGAVTAQLLWTGGFGWFVQQRMRWPLIAAAIVLLIFGFSETILGTNDERKNPGSRRQQMAPTVGWLLGLPVMVLLVVAPTSLGSAAADRVDAFNPTEASASGYPDLDPSQGPIEMRVFEFLERALWDEDRSLEGVPIRLEGLVVNSPEVSDGFLLTRFMVSCCAADGIPLQVAIRGAEAGLADDTWVIADVVWRPPDGPYPDNPGEVVVEADAVLITPVADAPNDPYESPY